MTIAEFNYCVDQYSDGLYRFVLKNIRDEAAAKDIIQDTYEKMWVKHDDITSGKAKSYLFTAAYHTLIDYTRRQKKKADYDEIEEEVTMLSNNTYTDLKENLEWALQQIPEVQRSVILLRDYEGYNYDEIGEITGLSESQVKVYIYRGRLALRKLIGNPQVLV
jgi:RNA polymerase sigma factor (sigma-70 family)